MAFFKQKGWEPVTFVSPHPLTPSQGLWEKGNWNFAPSRPVLGEWAGGKGRKLFAKLTCSQRV